MKKLFCALAGFALVAALVGCGGKDSSSAPAEAEPGTPGEVVYVTPDDGLSISVFASDKATYTPAEEIHLEISFDGLEDNQSAWVGVVPSTLPHNDHVAGLAAALDYVYLNSLKNGAISFQPLDPGLYDVRVYTTVDPGLPGAEIVYLPFVVEAAA